MKKRLLLIASIMIILGSVLYKHEYKQDGLETNSKNVAALNQRMSVLKNNFNISRQLSNYYLY